jgi:hypothetical protein
MTVKHRFERRCTSLVVALVFAMLLASAMRILQASACGAVCDEPELTNPGSQSNPLTSEYGYAATVLASNPTGYWRLDDVAGTSVKDSSPLHHDGTVVGQIARTQTGALADGSVAMRFSGASGTLIDVDDEAFRLTNAVTVEAWVKADAAENAGSLFEKSVGGPLSYRLAQEAGFWTWKVSGTFGELQRWTVVTPEDVGAWVHLVGTFDGTTTKLYKNGVLVHSQAAVGTLTTGAGISRLGALANEGYPLAGSLDEVAVYGTALTAGQIANHYALRVSTPAVSLQLTASDGDSDPLVYSATGLPPGLLIHPVSGVISGNPTVAGTYSVTATATDPGQLASNQTFTWTITTPAAVNPNRPVITNPGSQSSSVTQQHGYAGAVMMSSPIGYWRLEDYGGSTVDDWSGHGHGGTAAGGIVRAVSGPLSDGSLAMQFDGELGTRIDIADDAAFRLTGAVTVEAWVKTTQAYGTGVVFDKTQGGIHDASYRLMQEGDAWVWRVVGSFGTLNRWTPVTQSDVGAWVHLVGTFDGSTTRLYKNGVLMQSLEAVGTLTASAGSTRIGLLGYDAYAFPGSLDEIAVYGTALNAAQIASHYALRTTTSTVSLGISASDPDSDALTYSAIGLPVGLLINPITGVVSGNPTVSGSCDVTVTVRDSGGLAASQTFTWTVTTTVAPNPHRPVLTNPGNQTSPIAANAGYATSMLASTPVGYWRLDEGSGSTAADRATDPHAGTILGGVTLGETGALADGSIAMRFDGVTGSRIEIPTTSALVITNAVSVDLWAKADAQSGYGGLFDKTIGGTTNHSYQLFQETDRWVWRLWGSFAYVVVSTPVLSEDVGTWVHLVGTFDGSTARLFRNGELVASAPASGTIEAGDGVALIGHLGSNAYPFAGSIDEVAVFNTALSDTVIASQHALRTATAAVMLQLSGTDPDSDPLLYAVTGLPPTLVLNPTTGLISGNPTTAGSFNVTATARDPGGLAVSQSFTWTFAAPSVSVAMTSPFPNTIFRQPIDLTVAANATATNATIAQVEFFAGQTSLGTDSTAPYEVSWAAVPIGTYSITAVTTDSSGGTTTSAPISISVIQSGGDSGTLGTPIATPAPGMYAPGLHVTLTAAAGATIRYTIDGSTASATSPVYSDPIAITEDTHLSARAFQIGWTMSPSFEGTYRLDTTPPMVTAIVSPPPTAAGWSNTDVIVRFECTDPDGTGVDHCPGDVSVTGEGEGQVITRTATDHAGNSIDTSVTVNIDKTPPSLTLAEPLPSETDSPTLTVTGTVSDNLSGLSSIDCSGTIQSPQGGNLSCTLSLDPGGNALMVSVTDQAGNISSLSSRTRYAAGPATELHLSPQKFSLTAGGKRGLTLVDNFARTIEDATWSSSDEDVATIDDQVVSAISAGTTTITATLGSLSASVDVTVYGGTTEGDTTLPVGAVRWERQAPAGYYLSQVLMGMPDGGISEVTGSSRFAIEFSADAVSRPRVTAFDEDGRLKWASSLPEPGNASIWGYSNSLGGVLISDYGSILSVDGDGKPGWRYSSVGGAQILGQGPGGTIFLLEQNDGRITVLDGKQGIVRGRVDLPLSSREVQESGAHCVESPYPYKHYFSGSMSGRPAIDADDTLHLFVYSSDTLRTCAPPFNVRRYYNSRLELWSVTKSGGLRSTPLVSKSGETVAGHAVEMGGDQIVPTSDGALIFNWGWREPLPSGEFQAYGYLSRKQGGVSSVPVPSGLGDMVMGEGNTVFAQTSEGTSALDASNLNTRWTWTSTGGTLVTSTDGGGVMVHDGENLHTLDAQGTVISSTALSPWGKPSGTGWIFRSTDTTAVEQEAPPIRWPNAGFSMPGGSVLGLQAPMNCTPAPTTYRATPPGRDYYFYFSNPEGAPLIFSPYMRVAIRDGAEAWKSAGFPKRLEEWLPSVSPTATPNTIFKFHAFEAGSTAVGATLMASNDYGLGVGAALVRAQDDKPNYGPLTDKYQVSLRSDLFLTFPSGPPAPGAGQPFSEQLLRSLSVHELGHIIGLADVHETCAQKDTVMYPKHPTTSFRAEQVNWFPHVLPTATDLAALGRLYPPQ